MSLSDSQVKIANLALVRIAAAITSSLSPAQEQAGVTAINAVWDEVVDYVLFERHWPFAKRRVALAANSGYSDPFEQYDYSYALPEHFVRAHRLASGDVYEIVGDAICTNDDEAVLQYTRRGLSITNWSVGFKHALASRLAYEICYKVADQTGLQDALEKRYMTDLHRGYSKEASSQRPQHLERSSSSYSWLNGYHG